MFFPIGDINVKNGVKPIVTPILIVVNVVVFVWMFTMPPAMLQRFVGHFGCVPSRVLVFENLPSLFTSMFLHGGWMHIIGNMLFLWVFADNIEATIGRWRFLFFYLAGGLFATLAHVFFNPTSMIPCVGASGAIAACLGAYLVMYPNSKIKVLFILFLARFQVSAVWFLGIWIVQQFADGIGTLNASTSETSGVAYWAHIGGFVFGAIAGLFYLDEAKKHR